MSPTDLRLWIALAGVLATAPLAAQTTVTYRYTGAENQLSCRIGEDGRPSDAAEPRKPLPFSYMCDSPYLYQTFAFVNPLAAAQAFRVTFVRADDADGRGNPTILSAYLGSFDPVLFEQNYLGDGGFSCITDPCDPAASGSFSVLAPGHARVIVVANHLDPALYGGDSFTFRTNFPAAAATTVPEPSALALTAVGLAGLAGAARRRPRVRPTG